MKKTEDNLMGLMNFHLSPGSRCPWYLSIMTFGYNDSIPIMKNGNIIFFEEMEQIQDAYNEADNKDIVGYGPLPTDDGAGVYDIYNVVQLLQKNTIREKKDIIYCAYILDEIAKGLNLSIEKKKKEILLSLIRNHFNNTNAINFSSEPYTREGVLDAFRNYILAIYSRSLFLPLTGKLQRPRCKILDCLHFI